MAVGVVTNGGFRRWNRMKLRLDKYLSEIGLGTRSEVKKAIQKGLVQVNTQFVQKPEYKVDTEKDQVMFSEIGRAHV